MSTSRRSHCLRRVGLGHDNPLPSLLPPTKASYTILTHIEVLIGGLGGESDQVAHACRSKSAVSASGTNGVGCVPPWVFHSTSSTPPPPAPALPLQAPISRRPHHRVSATTPPPRNTPPQPLAHPSPHPPPPCNPSPPPRAHPNRSGAHPHSHQEGRWRSRVQPLSRGTESVARGSA
jgi:hypothetical protein